jgi:hypothetical protein
VSIQACVDEAGVQNTDEVFVLAGFLNSSERWREFSEDWHRCMSERPAISHFHMLEAASLSGQFTNWRREARDAKVRALVEVAKAHGTKTGDYRAIYFTTPFNVFEKRVVADIASKTLCAPYLWGLFLTMFAVHNDLDARGLAGDFEVIFDENKVFGRRAKILYPLIRDGVATKAGISLPREPLFKDDKDFLPLQLSDMLAWLLRRTWNGRQNEFEWVLDELKSAIPISPHSLMLCAHNADVLMAIDELSEKVPIPQNILDAWESEVGREAINSLTRKKKSKSA